ncbi:uncharacterized protein LOC119386959 [Rhipicephalus sanguineus]|uniref:uncharacterized protein LOC119386959 n=1 Tax=Rhipicephalus sanguineus TaxID=34632 RepID=UPI0018936E8D|nr:uncharacterized protein LOC119386959 [Rhipicephalus sanguineus]
MPSVCLKGWLSICSLVLALCSARAQVGEPLSQDVLDTFKIFEMHEYGIAMLDVDQDGDLDCLTARRTEFHKDPPSATYVWMLGGLNGKEKKEIIFHFKPGPTPDQAIFTMDGTDGTEQLLKTVYTDYAACALLQLPYGGREECMLWVTNESKNEVPQTCVDQFRQHCDVEVVAYDEDTCSQLEDNR